MFKRAGLKFLNKLASSIIEGFHVRVQNSILSIHLIYDQLRISLNEQPLHHPGVTEFKISCYTDGGELG